MKKNVGTIDKVIRVMIAVLIVGLYLTGQISGMTSIMLLILAGVFILTSIFSVCPLFYLFGISTRGKGKPDAAYDKT